ncbi:MAG: M15 family metallopeptidase [Synergistes sp.]|nr:M15 family metallopeptidase [Synergistes sp.]
MFERTMSEKKRSVLAVVCMILGALTVFSGVAYAEKKYDSMTAEEIAAQFYIKEINDDIFARIKGKSYKDDCTLPLSDLRYLHILHKDIYGRIFEGEMICNVYIAKDVLDIFKKLYKADYPIERVRLVDEYDADDETSMRDNNSSSFNFRFISHTKIVSKHGLGMAVDINPLYNPYVKESKGKVYVEPETAHKYTDRNSDFAYKIDKNDLAYKLFTEHGFEWGGNWKSVKDYQHFEVPDAVTKKLYKQ